MNTNKSIKILEIFLPTRLLGPTRVLLFEKESYLLTLLFGTHFSISNVTLSTSAVKNVQSAIAVCQPS